MIKIGHDTEVINSGECGKSPSENEGKLQGSPFGVASRYPGERKHTANYCEIEINLGSR